MVPIAPIPARRPNKLIIEILAGVITLLALAVFFDVVIATFLYDVSDASRRTLAGTGASVIALLLIVGVAQGRDKARRTSIEGVSTDKLSTDEGLTEALASPLALMREAAIVHIATSTGPSPDEAIEMVRDARKSDPDGRVRARAKWAIERLDRV